MYSWYLNLNKTGRGFLKLLGNLESDRTAATAVTAVYDLFNAENRPSLLRDLRQQVVSFTDKLIWTLHVFKVITCGV